MLAILLALAWPAPCADAGTCWLRWDATPRAERYEVMASDRLCAVIDGRWITRRDGSRAYVPPRPVYWPRPGDGCWTPGGVREYRVIACNDAGCGGAGEPVAFGPQAFRCFDHRGEITCD